MGEAKEQRPLLLPAYNYEPTSPNAYRSVDIILCLSFWFVHNYHVSVLRLRNMLKKIKKEIGTIKNLVGPHHIGGVPTIYVSQSIGFDLY